MRRRRPLCFASTARTRRAEHIRIEPDGTAQGFAHLRAGGGGQQRRGEGVELRRSHPVAEIDAIDDVAPLVRTAHLEPASGALVKLDEIVGLQDHVVEFEEGQRLFALEPHLHAVERQHAVHREVAADVAQEFEIVDAEQPVGIVDHQRVLGAVAVSQVVRKDRLDARYVGGDRFGRHQLPRLVLEGRVADHARAAAHQRNGSVSGRLQPVQHHDLNEPAGVQARSRGVEADIGSHSFRTEQLVEAGIIRCLMDETAFAESMKEIGLELGHNLSLSAG